MKTRLFLTAAAVLLLVPVSLWAHHAFAAEFDSTKPVKLRGTVAKMDWINPHAWIHIDVPATGGAPRGSRTGGCCASRDASRRAGSRARGCPRAKDER